MPEAGARFNRTREAIGARIERTINGDDPGERAAAKADARVYEGVSQSVIDEGKLVVVERGFSTMESALTYRDALTKSVEEIQAKLDDDKLSTEYKTFLKESMADATAALKDIGSVRAGIVTLVTTK